MATIATEVLPGANTTAAPAAAPTAAAAPTTTSPLDFLKAFWGNVRDYAPSLIRWTLILSTSAFLGPKLFALAASKAYLFAGLGNWIAAHTPAFVYAIGAKLSFLTPALNAIGAGAAWLLNALSSGLDMFSTLVMVAGQSALGAAKFGTFAVAAVGLTVINAAVDAVLTVGSALVDTVTSRNTAANTRPLAKAADATFGKVDRLATRAYDWTKAKLAPSDDTATPAATNTKDADGAPSAVVSPASAAGLAAGSPPNSPAEGVGASAKAEIEDREHAAPAPAPAPSTPRRRASQI